MAASSVCPKFSFSNATEEDVFLSFHMIRSNAAGLDGIPLRFVKLMLPFALPHFTYLFNQVVMRSSYPDRWKLSLVMPTHKRTRNFELDDFRAIHLIPVVSKALENLLSKQIVTFVASNKLLTKYQSGFRPAHSTAAALLNITDDILRNFGRREVAFLMLLDFTKAFDTVNHAVLRGKLRDEFHFEHPALNLISSFLNGRSHCVQIDDFVSSVLTTSKGVPQGSALSSLLFSLFINDLPDVLEKAKPHMYADDVQK